MKPTNLNKGLFTRKDFELHSHGKQKLNERLSDHGKEALDGLIAGGFTVKDLEEIEHELWKPTFYQKYASTIQLSITLIIGILLGVGGILLINPRGNDKATEQIPLNQSDESFATPLIEKRRELTSKMPTKGFQIQIEGKMEKKEIIQEKEREAIISQLPTKGVPMIVPLGKPKEVKLKVSTIQVPLFYVGQYKWVDYEKLFPDQYEEKELSGTEAIFENKFKVRVENGYTPFQKKSYRNRVEVATYYLEKGKIEQALKEMKRGLNEMPEDVNLNFYSGIISFQKEDYKSALEYFRNVKGSYPPLFEQEALWYEGLCLKEIGEIESALRIFKEIQSYDGFYSRDAEEEIKKIEFSMEKN